MSKPRPCISSAAPHDARQRLRWASIEDSEPSRSLQTTKDGSSSASTSPTTAGSFAEATPSKPSAQSQASGPLFKDTRRGQFGFYGVELKGWDSCAPPSLGPLPD